MVFDKLVKTATFGLGVAMALALGASEGSAQATSKTSKAPAAQPAQQKPAAGQQAQGLWYKVCMDLPVTDPVKPGETPKPQKPEDVKKVNACFIQADVRDNTTAILIGRLTFRQVAGLDKPQLIVLLPLTSALSSGAVVKVDEKEPIKLVYTNCDKAGCYAEATVESALLDQLKTGKQIAYASVDVSGRLLSIPLPLDGFAKALDGKALPLEKYNENEQKIADIIRQRLAEVRKQQEDRTSLAVGTPK